MITRTIRVSVLPITSYDASPRKTKEDQSSLKTSATEESVGAERENLTNRNRDSIRLLESGGTKKPKRSRGRQGE